MRRRLSGVAVLMSLLGASAHAQSGSAFDGSWLVVIYCDPSREAAEYTLQFPASVRGGVLHGEHGKHGETDSLSLDGQIQPDGTAMIGAQGMTGPTRFNVGHTPNGIPYHYTLQSRFDATRGTGTRLELRPCRATFTRM